MVGINFEAIEEKWQKLWSKKKIFEVKEGKGKKYYVLEMYPYPSASGLHIGHAFNYVIGDIFSRYNIMNGFNVLHPMGYDSLGLPAENAAIKANSHPKKFTEKAIKNFIMQQKALGLTYDWTRLLWSHNPDYYKWNQYWFLKFMEKGLVYRKKAPVNFCEKCDTVLANEQVHNGFCWRHPETEIQTKQLEQWFIKTTKYAEELLGKVDSLNWPERIKIMQKNWIGKSPGLIEYWKVEGIDMKLESFTTMPHTTYGASFMVIAPEHPIVLELVKGTKYEEGAKEFIKKAQRNRIEDPTNVEKQKEGFFIGRYVINHLNGRKMPLFIANFAIMDYGTGIVKCTPTHDQRDYEFAKKYDLGFYPVIDPPGKKLDPKTMKSAYTDLSVGTMVNAGEFTGMDAEKAKEAVADYTVKMGDGKKVINYKLKDWLVSRQRYWGTPIPIIYCEKCGIVPVPEKDLPVKLPEKVKFGKGNPLLTNKKFVNVKCPKCEGKGKRETDTMDTFFDSSWYFLRFCDNKNKKQAFDKKKVQYWMPVDQYIGGAEHACMHLIYARFFVKALRDMKFLNFDEPFTKLFNQGMVHGPDGAVMAKSRGNVVNPIDIIKKYSADVLRFYLVSNASPDKDFVWSDKALDSSYRFIVKIMSFNKFGKTSKLTESKLNRAIKNVTEQIENYNYNLSVIELRQFFDAVFEQGISKKDFSLFLKLFSVFCPHICEELWHKLGNKTFISLEKWPAAGKIDEKLLKQEQVIEKLILDIKNIMKILESRGEKNKKEIKIFAIPNEVALYKQAEEKLEKTFGMKVEVLNIKEAGKTGKVIKAVPGKPGILIE